jgi:hypothetical protein
MYSAIPQGSSVNIQGLECHIPPEGYVFNIATRAVEHRGVHERSPIPEEQYWERVPMPTWYHDVIKEEKTYNKRKKEDDPPFYDERYEEYKAQEWDRRLNGFWYRNNGVATYITGTHYIFMQHWQIDIGFPRFRVPDLEYFYFLQYCIEDPECMGMIEVCKRRFGKSFRAGLFLYEYVTRTRNTQAGIQSKTGTDAKKFFGKTVVQPFKKLPEFFRPEYDTSLGITPKSEIRFQQTNVRGKKAEFNEGGEELNSSIDHASADEVAYDGQKLHRYVADECGKTVEANIYDRHEVVRYCLLDDEGRIIGKALYTTTVEKLDSEKDGVQEAFLSLWNESDQTKRHENGRTGSGLYRFFTSASRSKNFDKYGFPDVEKTLREIMADRKSVQNNARSLAARKRKEPITIDEALYEGNDKCEFSAENLLKQIQLLELTPKYLRRIRLIDERKIIKSDLPHVKDKEKRSIKWMDDSNGGWLLLEEPTDKNRFTVFNGLISPENMANYCIGVDTFRIGHAEEGSQGTICVFKKSCVINGAETGNYPVAFYSGRPKLIQHLYDEVIKACMFYGCKVNFEISAGDFFYGYFHEKDCLDLLYWTPAVDPNKKNFQLKPGTESASPFELAAQLEAAKMYIDGTDPHGYNGNVHLIQFPSLLKQCLKYDHAKRTPYDEVIALMMALLPAIKIPEKPKNDITRPQTLMPTYNLSRAVA